MLIPTTGTILNTSPATGAVKFTRKDGISIRAPFIGWATVVTWVDRGPDTDLGDLEYETTVYPLVLIDGQHAVTTVDVTSEGGEYPGATVEVEL